MYGALSLLRYETYHSRSLDMAYYVRLVWGLAHGRPDNPIVGAPHWLGLHLEPMLFPLAWLSRLHLPIAELLLVAQAVCAALALVPLHAFSRGLLGPLVGEAAALLAALSIYLVPTVSRCVDYDFHPTTMAIAPIAAWIASVGERRWGRAFVWFAVSLSFREDIGLQLAAASAAIALGPIRSMPPESTAAAGSDEPAPHRADRAPLLLMTALGTLWFFGYALLVQPRYLPDPASSSFGAHFDRFGGGAGGVGGVLLAAAAHPLALVGHLVSGDRPWSLVALLSTVGFVALAAPRWLAGALPIVAINLVSDFAGVRRVESHYATAMAPFLVAAAIEGSARIAASGGLGDTRGSSFALLPPRLPRAIAVVLLVAASGAWWWCRGAAPGAPDFSLGSYTTDENGRASRARAVALQHEPRVEAEVRLLAHLAERPEPLLLPEQRTYWKK